MPEVDGTLRWAGCRVVLAVAALFVLVALPLGNFAEGRGLATMLPGSRGEMIPSGASSDGPGSPASANGKSAGAVKDTVPGADASNKSSPESDASSAGGTVSTRKPDAPALASNGPAGDSTPSARGDDTTQSGKPSNEPKAEKKGYEPEGPTLVTGALGFTYGLTDDSVGGFELAFTYGYRLTDWIWFDSQANFSFGSDCKDIVVSGVPKGTRCGSVHGFGISLLAGVQWKFYDVWRIPVIPFLRADVGVVFVVTNGPYDGAAFVARGGGGARYHFTPWFSVGGELAFVVGPVVRNDMPTNFFASVDVIAGAEFTF